MVRHWPVLLTFYARAWCLQILRAALYKAAALIPGVSVTDDQAALDGQSRVAIGRVEGALNVRQDITIDPTTGQLIGEREVT